MCTARRRKLPDLMLKRLASFFLHISCCLYKQLKAARRWLRFVNKLYFPPRGESIQRIKTRRAVSQVFIYLKSGVTIFSFSHEFLLDCKFSGTQRSNVSQCGSWCLKDFLYAFEACLVNSELP